MLKLSCSICGDKHKARSDKFPITKEGKDDKQGKVMGHICKKCLLKGLNRSKR